MFLPQTAVGLRFGMEVAPPGVPLTSKQRLVFCGKCARCMGKSHHVVGAGAARLPLSMRIDALQASAIYRVTDCRARSEAFPSGVAQTPCFGKRWSSLRVVLPCRLEAG